ncbi:Uma2 family endonuclease [Hymenobacter sp. IS2118]|uniref:Uma2 family endonuclease n=1 Tax=Hymenobacter sp. IS2118 TaxID=1505605 RepID=UPI00068B1813|nr:Uma2 family endonuclease [Hymenobacter sp. IS2118]
MQPITQLAQLDPNGSYTYADYLTWEFAECVELIKSKVLRPMSAPTFRHQQYSTNLVIEIGRFLKGKPCRVYAATFDVRLTRSDGNGDFQIKTVVQPDICVVCDLAKIDARGCVGAPDWIKKSSRPATRATTPKPSSTSTRKTACANTG